MSYNNNIAVNRGMFYSNSNRFSSILNKELPTYRNNKQNIQKDNYFYKCKINNLHRSNSEKSTTLETSSQKKENFSKIVTQTLTHNKKNMSTNPNKINSINRRNQVTNSLNLKYLLPPLNNSQKKTLVLDLDETLIHSNFEEFEKGSDIKINVKIDNVLYKIFAIKRPGVEEFLERMGKIFEVVIYTASLQQVIFINNK